VAIGNSAEDKVTARGDEDDLHGAIRGYDFEIRLDWMFDHGIPPPLRESWTVCQAKFWRVQFVFVKLDDAPWCGLFGLAAFFPVHGKISRPGLLLRDKLFLSIS
jgi:hypothetical protein